MTERIMKLGITDGYGYIGVQPPLTQGEIESLPMVRYGAPEDALVPLSTELHKDGSQTIGLPTWPFHRREDLFPEAVEGDPQIDRFVEYAKKVAMHIGGVMLDPAVRSVGPGSLFTQEQPTD